MFSNMKLIASFVPNPVYPIQFLKINLHILLFKSLKFKLLHCPYEI
jgi:hypothetical protein